MHYVFVQLRCEIVEEGQRKGTGAKINLPELRYQSQHLEELARRLVLGPDSLSQEWGKIVASALPSLLQAASATRKSKQVIAQTTKRISATTDAFVRAYERELQSQIAKENVSGSRQ